jgi:uncharacterized lipoprotein YehR (DUF1307 family)
MSRPTALLLLALVAVFALAGCETSAEDRAFFQEGWRHPEEGADKRMNASGW